VDQVYQDASNLSNKALTKLCTNNKHNNNNNKVITKVFIKLNGTKKSSVNSLSRPPNSALAFGFLKKKKKKKKIFF